MRNKGLVRGTIQVQIDDEHWVSYHYSNCDGDPYACYTFYKGDLCVPEYSEEILHSLYNFQILNRSELLRKASNMLDIFNHFVKSNDEDNKEIPQFEGTLEQLNKLNIRGEENED